MYTLELTEEELDFIYERCSRKAARLEEAHLEDIPCYNLSWQIMSKIFKVRKTKILKEKINMNTHDATEVAYKNGFEAGVSATEDALRKGIEEMLSDDTEIIVAEGEVFIPISAVRKLISELEVNNGIRT